MIVSENHTGFPRRTLGAVDRRIARFAFVHASLVCPASEDLGRQIAAHGIDARMEAVPNVVDVDRFVAPAGPRPTAGHPTVGPTFVPLRRTVGWPTCSRPHFAPSRSEPSTPS